MQSRQCRQRSLCVNLQFNRGHRRSSFAALLHGLRELRPLRFGASVKRSKPASQLWKLPFVIGHYPPASKGIMQNIEQNAYISLIEPCFTIMWGSSDLRIMVC